MSTPTQAQLLEQLVSLTDAVRRLAEHTAPEPVVTGAAEADRVRARVAFSYRALGTLTGRVSTTGTAFDVPVVGAFRRRGFVLLTRLVPGAEVAELRAGARSEVLRIHPLRNRDDDIDRLVDLVDLVALRADPDGPPDGPPTGPPTGRPAVDVAPGSTPGVDALPVDRPGGSDDPSRARPRFGRVGVVLPEAFSDSDPIGSVVVMRSRRGPLLAFGPRLAALPAVPTHRPV
ncbi:hypothetical protein [Cellulomonas endophytica]|uniref:hypothetical protein n=1 Tax=Cellulomonas endophytica TaxID=2494735 RepID=UPI001011C4D5|nr:hypothetical protein [Cellulomonas endophytica]